MLVRKTAAFGWSIEHAVAWWDTSLFLTKWVHTLQVQEKTQPPDDEEKKILEQVKTVLGEMEHEYDVTPRMGSVLTKLADAYEKNLQEENARS
ncbi:Zinc finger C2H2-type protein [Neofusicoccum parvum]|uniref:Putative zinc finger protein n=1 Tax=Botryosphaeria parva (strain UCR-NP2) TaxID=1287680 RepID=R1FVH8_BOTPV|nr:putative zinc finger protein [Neofusicoccum parvum UCRNP2]GME34886.1 Zinc finger C2H2-type protein [Neofusicoccum parvum]